jgi:hypothetical protein
MRGRVAIRARPEPRANKQLPRSGERKTVRRCSNSCRDSAASWLGRVPRTVVAGECIAELLELPDGCNALFVDGAHVCAASATFPAWEQTPSPSLPSPQLEEEGVEEPPKHDHDNDAHHHPLQDIAPGHCESPRALRSAFLTMLNASSVIAAMRCLSMVLMVIPVLRLPHSRCCY